MGDDNTSRLNAALSMARKGFKVFPLKPGKKTPAHDGWQAEATTDEAQITVWWSRRDYNIGINTGDGLVVLDIDVKNDKPGAASFKALGLSREEIDTFRVKTASGGWHVYYTGDGPSGVNSLGLGLDVRGIGGYAVGPGSILTNGSGSGSYTVDHDAEVLAVLPAKISDRLGDPRERPERSVVPAVDLDRVDTIQRATTWLLGDAPVAVEGGGGDLATYKVAAVLKDYGLSKETAFELMEEHWNERCSPPWDYEDLQTKVANAYDYGVNQPGSAHPAVSFADVAVPAVERSPSGPWYRHGDPWDRNIQWLYHSLAPRVGVMLIIGPSNSGKTFVEIELARSQAKGTPFFRITPDCLGGVVFGFAGTEGSSFPMRLEALREDQKLPISSLPIGNLAERGALGALLTLLREESARMLANFGVPLRMFILETLSASGLLINENDNSEAARALANLGTLARELGILVITAHHPPKNGLGERGAGSIRGSADYILEIERDGRDSLRRLELTKARDAEQRQLGTFTLLPVILGEDDKGRPITSMKVSMGEPIQRITSKSEHSDFFMKAMEFAIMDEPDSPEGHRAASWERVRDTFVSLKPGNKKGNEAVVVFKRCAQYAEEIGAIGSGVFAGERFLWMMEIHDAD